MGKLFLLLWLLCINYLNELKKKNLNFSLSGVSEKCLTSSSSTFAAAKTHSGCNSINPTAVLSFQGQTSHDFLHGSSSSLLTVKRWWRDISDVRLRSGRQQEKYHEIMKDVFIHIQEDVSMIYWVCYSCVSDFEFKANQHQVVVCCSEADIWFSEHVTKINVIYFAASCSLRL